VNNENLEVKNIETEPQEIGERVFVFALRIVKFIQ
jgi:hypothetical protein